MFSLVLRSLGQYTSENGKWFLNIPQNQNETGRRKKRQTLINTYMHEIMGNFIVPDINNLLYSCVAMDGHALGVRNSGDL